MFSHFFIERPIFATVLSLVITLAGRDRVLQPAHRAVPAHHAAQHQRQCTYPGANAQVVADSVAAPIEQQVNGVENMLYMVSQSNNDGSYTLTVTFKPGVNLNFAQVLVQNRINLALPLLPDVVKQAGVITRKRNPDILQVIAIFSPEGALRPALPEQLRHDQDQGRAGPRAGHRRRGPVRPAGLQHEALGRSRAAGGARTYRPPT